MADFYFGNLLTGAVKRPAPKTDMGADSVGESEKLSFANGGAFVAQSDGTHREFAMAWGVQPKSAMDFLKDYRNGAYGTGLLYMIDPFASNHMPPHWANPSLTYRGWPSLVSPSVQPVSAPAAVATNLATNPSFETASGLVTTRTNRWADPNTLSAIHYQGVNGATRTMEAGKVRVVCPAGGLADSGLGLDIARTPTVAAGETVTYSVDITARVADTYRLSVQGATTAGAATVTSAYSATLAVGESARLVYTVTHTAAGSPAVYVLRKTPAVASEFDASNWLIEPALVGQPFFSGNTPAEGDFTYAWTGAVNASASIQRGVGVYGVSQNARAYAIQSSRNNMSGSKSLRVWSNWPSEDSFIDLAGMLPPSASLKANTKYTAVARVTLEEVRPSGFRPRFRFNFGSDQYSSQVPNVVGTHELRWTFSMPTIAAGGFARFMPGGKGGESAAWLDDFMFIEGEYTGPYFDGSTRFVDSPAGVWNGEPNASTSTVSRAPGNMPNTGAQYTLAGAPGSEPQRKLTLMIPEDRDLYLGFTGTSNAGAALRMQTIRRDGSYGPVQDLTLLDPLGNTRLNTKVSGQAYRAVQVYMTPTGAGAGIINLVSSKAIYALPTETPVLTGGHTEGEGHTGLRLTGDPTMTYIQAANGRKMVTTAANFTEIEAWL